MYSSGFLVIFCYVTGKLRVRKVIVLTEEGCTVVNKIVSPVKPVPVDSHGRTFALDEQENQEQGGAPQDNTQVPPMGPVDNVDGSGPSIPGNPDLQLLPAQDMAPQAEAPFQEDQGCQPMERVRPTGRE